MIFQIILSLIDIKPPRMVSRRGWLAQPPSNELEQRTEPAKFVILGKRKMFLLGKFKNSHLELPVRILFIRGFCG